MRYQGQTTVDVATDRHRSQVFNFPHFFIITTAAPCVYMSACYMYTLCVCTVCIYVLCDMY